MAVSAKSKADKPKRPDGRHQLLVYLDPELIKRLKKSAIDEDRNAYEIVENAVEAWLARPGDKKTS